MSSDERLVRRAATGDQRAMTAIYRRYSQDLYRFCLAIVGEPQDAQDALQNTMVKVLRSLPGEERRIELKPWLYRIAHNESVELLRRRRPSEELEPEQALGRGADLAEDVAVRERLRRLIADLGQLPERQRGALVMRELSGLAYDEIAAALGTSAAVARQTLYEARLSLRQMDAGREMECEVVTRALSDADGRVTRRRDLRAHLRTCPACRRFRAELEGRRGDLAALSPLPAVVGAGLLQGLLGGGGAGAGAGAGAAGTLGGGASSLGVATALKSAAAVAVVAAVGVGAADRIGLVDAVPFDDGNAPRVEGEASAPSGAPVSSSTTTVSGAAPGGSGSAPVRQAGAVGGGTSVGVATPAPGGGFVPRASSPATPAADGAHPRGRGNEPQHPSAASHGQETAASHKADKGGAGEARPDKADHPATPAKPDKPGKPAQTGKPTHAAQPGPPAGGKAHAPESAASVPTSGPQKGSAAPAPAGPEAVVPPVAEEAPDKGKGPAFQP